MSHREIQNYPNIQPTIVHSNQAKLWGHSDWYYSSLGSFNSVTDFRSGGSGRNIDNRIRMNSQGPIGTIIPETNSVRRFPFRRMLYFTNWNTTGNDARRSEDPVCNNIFENSERKNNFWVEKVGRENSVIWYHKYSNSIHVDTNHADYNQLIPEYSTSIGLIND